MNDSTGFDQKVQRNLGEPVLFLGKSTNSPCILKYKPNVIIKNWYVICNIRYVVSSRPKIIKGNFSQRKKDLPFIYSPSVMKPDPLRTKFQKFPAQGRVKRESGSHTRNRDLVPGICIPYRGNRRQLPYCKVFTLKFKIGRT